MVFFWIGCSISLAVILSIYSKLAGIVCLVISYGLFRIMRPDQCDGIDIVPDLDELVGRIKPMEVLKETEDELVVRGSERVLILNRNKATISGLQSLLTTFDKVRCVRICQQYEQQSSRIASYSVILSLGTFSSICLGYTDSQIEASLVAAKLSSWTGKEVFA